MLLGNKRAGLKDIENYVVIKCATNWKQLRKNLDIDDDWLNIFETDNPHNCVNCCSKILSEWLDLNPNTSWEFNITGCSKQSTKCCKQET